MKNLYKFSLVFLLIVVSIGRVSAQGTSSTFEISKNLDIFATMYKELNNNYVDELNHGELVKTSIEALLGKLDPYTVFISEADIEDYSFMTTGQYGGIGALIHKQGEYIVVSEPYEGSPSQKAGLIPGDKILKVNDRDTKGKSVSDVSTVLKGEPGTRLKVQVLRDGNTSPQEIEVLREKVSIPNVAHSLVMDGDVGYIKLTGFTQNSGKEVKDAFLKMRENPELKGLIIDLRDNGGGLMNEAVTIANLFMKKGELIVSTKGKTPDRNKSYKTLIQPIDTEIPIVVLVNAYSASASEIVAGAMQDLDRAVIIGQRTFGKGLVQNIIPLSYNTQMKITVAKYYIPSGRCIQSIDYGHKDSLGFAGKIPDSLTNSFMTRGGRVVFDGGGISPDLTVEQPIMSNIAISLLTRYLIFDYANKFKRENSTIPSAKEFVISEEIYGDFVNWLQDKDFDYVTRSEKLLSELKKTAESEKYYQELSAEFALLESKMMHNKQTDLEKFGDEIKSLLRNEIVSRYYFQKGRIEAGVTEDPEVAKAKEILLNREVYNSILGAVSIGKNQ
ncbi:MAG: peptidase S41 [Bacteroidetes bacterium HGW-Bacteroidetes-11]|jgi:carboxyl-terminal processing protease|nr:MAG: peptidase S41 [Bacteroidetes bacterium HGW-Bacteroidetes-11]